MKLQRSRKHLQTQGNILSENTGAAPRTGKRAICGLAMMAALGISVSAAIVTAPGQSSAAAAASLPTAAADVIALQQGDLSGFYKNEALVTLSLSDVETESAFLRKAFRGESLAEAKKDFSDYSSALSDEQKDRADALIAAQAEKEAEEEAQRSEAAQAAALERLQAEQAAAQEPLPAAQTQQTQQTQTQPQQQTAQAQQQQAAAQAAQTAIWQSGSYVRLNTQGIPMSEKQGEVLLDENGVPLNYTRCITGIATAYTDDPITSTGTVPMQGTVAVDPSIIPYGTRMWITSADGLYVYGLAIAEDTGGFIYLGNAPKADLYMYSEADCDEWGWRDAVIYILD